ncbi:MAG: ATPase, T2SS/T4P/T4SS family [Paenibacillaceae bacterium]
MMLVTQRKVAMKPRIQINVKEGMIQYETLEVKPDNKLKRRGKTNFQVIPLSQAVDLIYEHITELSKGNNELRQYVLDAGLGNPMAQDKMKAMVDNLLVEHRIEVEEATLIEPMNATESIFALTCGAGLLEDLYRMKDVEEVQVVGVDIFIIRNGESLPHPRKFASLQEVRLLQDRLALCGKKPINEKNPVLQSYMYNRSRLVMARENFSDVPLICIRNFIVRDVTLDALIQLGTIDDRMAQLLQYFVKFHASIIVGGSTNTGKTTFLFALAQQIPIRERIITLEKEFEISLRERLNGKRNIVSLREVTETDLPMEEAFKPILVMSPKWVVIGEAKGAEVSQMIQGSLRGHDVMGTIHTKYRESFMSDVVDMVKQDGRIHGDHNLKGRIARAFNIIIFLRLIHINGVNRRVVTEITELYADSEDQVYVNPLIVWNYETQTWEATGNKLSKYMMEHMITYNADAETFRRLGVY